MHPGVHHGLSNADYHASPGLSATQLRRLLRSPFHFAGTLGQQFGAVYPQDEDTNPSLFNGTLTHCALLEPGEFHKRYVIGPTVSKNSLVWRDFVAVATERGQQVITMQEQDKAFAQARSLAALPEVAELLRDGAPEVSAWWMDEDDETPAGEPVLCRCRPDWVASVAHGAGVVLLDVKTTKDASPAAFGASVARYGYHVQQAHYLRGYRKASGLEVHGFVFAVVESEYPHAAMAYMLDDEAAAEGVRRRRQAMARYRECRRTNHWPAYGVGIQTVSLPRWSLSE